MSESPLPDATALAPKTFFRVISYKASFGELWRDARSPAVTLLWATKILRLPIRGILNDLPAARLRPFETNVSRVAPEALKHLREMAAPLLRGAIASEPFAYFVAEDLVNNCRFYFCLLNSTDRKSVFRLTARVTAVRTLRNPRRIVEIFSAMSDETIFCSTNSQCYQDPPSGVRLNHQLRKSATSVAESHQALIASRNNVAISFPSDEAAFAIAERYHIQTIEDGVRRGLYRALNSTEMVAAQQLMQINEQAEMINPADVQVIVEIERLQQKRNNWLGGLVTLGLTIGLFAFTSRGQAGGGLVLGMIILVLFVHEAGHYVAMRIFGYRNVQMFFIPFFGAAVKGQHYNVPGWKKAVVALMGPLPGIAIGTVVGIVGMVTHQQTLIQISLLTLLINGSNLLPILPFDGGRVAHAVLFTRHWLPDVIFRIAAAAVLIAIGIKLGDRIFAPLGIALLLGIPAATRTARAVAALRKTNLPTVSPDAQNIPPEVAEAIIGKVRSQSARPLTNGVIARRVLNIYEMLNARPPGWLATIGFGALQLGALITVIIVGFAVIVAGNPQLARQFQRGLQTPTRPLTMDEIAIATGTPLAIASTAPTTRAIAAGQAHESVIVIANASSVTSARAAFQKLRQQVRPGEMLELFGASLLAAPSTEDALSRQRWITALQAVTKDVFVRSSRNPEPCLFRIITRSNTSAAALAEQISDYLQLNSTYDLVPPWSTDKINGERRTEFERARRTLQRVQRAGSSTSTSTQSPQSKAMQEKIAEAIRLGDDAQLKELQADQHKTYLAQRRLELKAIAQDPAADHNLAKIYIDRFADSLSALPDLDETDDAIPSTTPSTMPKAVIDFQQLQHDTFVTIGPMLGQVVDPREPNSTGGENRQSIAGMATSDGPIVEITFWSMPDLLDNLPIIAKWLNAQDCKTLSYNLGTSTPRPANGFHF